MSTHPPPAPGSIGWKDLTVDNAEEVRDFYMAIAGWTAQPVSMGDYDDFVMLPPSGGEPSRGEPIGGICHRRGANTDIPAQWLLYIVVPDLEAALGEVLRRGGKVLTTPRSAGGGRFAVIADPGGATCALYASGAT